MISVNGVVSLKQGSIPQTNIKHLTLNLPFGYTHADLKLDPNPNSKFQNVSKVQKLFVIATKAK